tara:strand:+ start:246 stop:704 length:459 start_codon:yes stop_codon:yes gene_type:complete
MSFANFDSTDITNGKVTVSFTNETITNDSFAEFLNNWNNCDLMQTPYSFYFDTRNGLGNAKIKYAFGIVRFIKKKKKEPIKYLQYSLINVNSNRNLLLLRMIFNLSSPIAPVYIFSNNEDDFIEKIRTEIDSSENNLSKEYKKENKVHCFKP